MSSVEPVLKVNLKSINLREDIFSHRTNSKLLKNLINVNLRKTNLRNSLNLTQTKHTKKSTESRNNF